MLSSRAKACVPFTSAQYTCSTRSVCSTALIRQPRRPCILRRPPKRSFAVLFSNISSERSEGHTSELQSLMRISYAVICLKKKTTRNHNKIHQFKHSSHHNQKSH